MGGLALRCDSRHVPHQTDALQDANHDRGRVELEATKSVSGRGGKGVVVVVPGLAKRSQRQPREVAGLIVGLEALAPEEVTQRVDAERDVVQDEDAYGAAPQQASQPRADRTADRHPKSER